MYVNLAVELEISGVEIIESTGLVIYTLDYEDCFIGVTVPSTTFSP